MVTLIKYGALSGGEKYNINQMWIDGLSTDSKPTTTIEGMPIPNGSVYTEVDTGKTYMFDKDNTTWYEVSLGGGGGGGGGFTPTQAQLDAMNSGIDSEKVAQIETNESNILLKANTSDVTTATANLQAQIDELITPVTQDAEVQNARVGADGTSYQTLKARLDGENSELKEDLVYVFKESHLVTEKTGSFVTVDDDTIPYAEVVFNENQDDILHTGKNLLEYPYYYNGSRTINGITYEVRDDGSIFVSGTATSNSTYVIVNDISSDRKSIKAGTYTLSGMVDDESLPVAQKNYITIGLTGIGNRYEYGDGLTFTLTSDTTFYLFVTIKSGNTVNFVLKPQIEVGSLKTDFEKNVSETLLVGDFRMFNGVNNFISDSVFTIEYMIKKPNSVINLKDYGAIGDGITDDTLAINNALEKAKNGILVIPKGTYLFSGTLHVKENTIIIGSGRESLLKLADNYSLDAYTWRTNLTSQYHYRYPMVIVDENTSNCILENFSIEGQTSGFVDENEDGLCVKGRNHIIKNLVISKINYYPDQFTNRNCITPGYGINVINANTITIENCNTFECGYEGIGTESSKNVVVSGCLVGDTNQTGIQIHLESKHIRVTNCSVQYSEGKRNGSMTFDADPAQPMGDIHIANNYFCNSVIFVAGGEHEIFLTNNYIGGVISCNNQAYRQKHFITGNMLGGGIVLYADKSIVSSNGCTAGSGSYMIRLYGNKSIAVNNIAFGDSEEVIVVPHEET